MPRGLTYYQTLVLHALNGSTGGLSSTDLFSALVSAGVAIPRYFRIANVTKGLEQRALIERQVGRDECGRITAHHEITETGRALLLQQLS